MQTRYATLLERGRALLSRNDLPEARSTLECALALEAHGSEALLLLAAVHAQQGDMQLARHRIEIALASNPVDPAAHNALGNLLRMEGRLDDAVASYRRAIDVTPGLAAAHSNCALCLQDLGRYDLAQAHYRAAIAADPGDLTVTANLISLLFDLGEFADALAHADRLLGAHPGFAQGHWVTAFGLLRHGDFQRGWREYQWREHPTPSPAAASQGCREWDGTAMSEGNLIVFAEQGLGDQIMFASCLDDLRPLVAHCVVECDPRLKVLFTRSFPRVRFYAQRKRLAEPWLADGLIPDARTWIGSLPFHFRRRVEDFPARRAYLQPDAARAQAWTQQLHALGNGLKVGISWRGGVPATRRALRSIALREWTPILQCPDVHIISLQYGDCIEEISEVSAALGVRIHHWQDAITDYDATAALVHALDIVISVQTSLVHLTGALGKRAWVLVPRIAEWRYGESGDTMPWYPSVRLFRQRTADWSEVIERVRTELIPLNDGTRPGRT